MTDDGEFLFECVEDKVVHPVSVVEALARVGHADVGARDGRNFRSRVDVHQEKLVILSVPHHHQVGLDCVQAHLTVVPRHLVHKLTSSGTEQNHKVLSLT